MNYHEFEDIRPIKGVIMLPDKTPKINLEYYAIDPFSREKDWRMELRNIPGCFTIRDSGAQLDDPGADYTKSGIDGLNKFTEKCCYCLSILFSASDRAEAGGANISLMFHVAPGGFDPGASFRKDFPELLRKFKARSAPGSMEIVVAGGIYEDDFSGNRYVDSLKMVSKTTERGLDLLPWVIMPKMKQGLTSIYFDTGRRRLIVAETEQGKRQNTIITPAQKIGKMGNLWFSHYVAQSFRSELGYT